jgi:hypothetical protein
MERAFYLTAKDILGIDFIGPDELNAICHSIGLKKIDSVNFPELLLTEDELHIIKGNNCILFAVNNLMETGELISIATLRKAIRQDGGAGNIGFYNQDWYIKELFYSKQIESPFWAVLPKEIPLESRKKIPSDSDPSITLPSAIMVSYLFFVYYYHSNGTLLWKNDYIWCDDIDHNQDMIYVGRYEDPAGINQNGFSIHRHLKISPLYGYFSGRVL